MQQVNLWPLFYSFFLGGGGGGGGALCPHTLTPYVLIHFTYAHLMPHLLTHPHPPTCYANPPLCDLAGALFGILGKYTNKLGRDVVVLLGMLVHLGTFLLIFFNLPDGAIGGPVTLAESKGYLLNPSK